MILTLIENYLTDIVNRLNERYDRNILLKRILTENDITNIPNNEKYINYALLISGVDNQNTQSGVLDVVSVRIEFLFSVVNSNYKKYQDIFAEYLYPIYRTIKNDYDVNVKEDLGVSYNLYINGIENVKINNSDNFETAYFKPNITFDLWITDNN
jgi:hypothetical protein